jgi:surface-anchored protein
MNKPLILLASALALAARADVRMYNGHADIGVGYDNGSLDLHVHQEEPFEAEYEPGEVTFVVGDAAKTLSPGGLFAPALGSAGSPIWVLPTSPNPDLPFIGFGTEELSPADWLGNITLTLAGFSGPGNMAIWNIGSFGDANIVVDSTRGTGPLNSMLLLPGTHTHYNIGFTQPGRYEVSFDAVGTHTPTQLAAMGSGTYRFEVVPEPSTYALMGLGAAVVLWSVRRRR